MYIDQLGPLAKAQQNRLDSNSSHIFSQVVVLKDENMQKMRQIRNPIIHRLSQSQKKVIRYALSLLISEKNTEIIKL